MDCFLTKIGREHFLLTTLIFAYTKNGARLRKIHVDTLTNTDVVDINSIVCIRNEILLYMLNGKHKFIKKTFKT